MMNVYSISYDIKLSGKWLDGGQSFPWAKQNVLCHGDARAACHKLEKIVKREDYEGKRPSAIRVTKVEVIARDVVV